ncbi:MAG: DUF1573 domain-containing protein [Flavobacteriaceae bacterium]|nr:MAG: DUF1573 domain-containing protein [Flavobacteriaceae bacterium]
MSCDKNKQAVEAATAAEAAAVATADEATQEALAIAETSEDQAINGQATAEAQNPANVQDLPIMTFQENFFDFGDVKKGQHVEHVFSFTNTGKTPLIIKDAKGTCGCTVPEFPKEPIAPGAKGSIKVKFDSSNFIGKTDKAVNIQTNTANGVEMLKITTNIIQ